MLLLPDGSSTTVIASFSLRVNRTRRKSSSFLQYWQCVPPIFSLEEEEEETSKFLFYDCEFEREKLDEQVADNRL